jgi:hypothetical protein
VATATVLLPCFVSACSARIILCNVFVQCCTNSYYQYYRYLVLSHNRKTHGLPAFALERKRTVHGRQLQRSDDVLWSREVLPYALISTTSQNLYSPRCGEGGTMST